MKYKSLAALAAAVLLFHALTCHGSTDNTVTFDNQSGQPALVKLVGPTPQEVEVPVGQKRTVTASPGQYYIKTRYGTPGRYRYTKGDDFLIKETATTRSQITITLHKVVGGNYETEAISAEEFATTSPAHQTRAQTLSRPSEIGEPDERRLLPSELAGMPIFIHVNCHCAQIDQWSPPIGEALSSILNRLGANVLTEQRPGGHALLAHVEATALGAKYSHAGVPSGFYYTGGRVQMRLSLSISDSPPVVVQAEHAKPPLRAFVDFPLPSTPKDVQFSQIWPRALMACLSELLGPEFSKECMRKDITDLFEGFERDAFLTEMVAQLEDQDILATIAKTERTTSIREAAARKITDQEVLAHIARTDIYEYIRKEAVSRLNNQQVLDDIAQNDEKEHVRQAARDRLEAVQPKSVRPGRDEEEPDATAEQEDRSDK